MRKFFITIGRRGSPPRIAMEVMAQDSQRAGEQADDLAEPGERVDVAPVPTEEELQAADVARNVDKAARFHSSNDAIALEDQVRHMHCVGGLL